MQASEIIRIKRDGGVLSAALRERGHLQPGETLLVLGATGTVGAAALQLGKLGARVIGAATGAAKCAAVQTAEADAVVDLAAGDSKDQVKALACPAGVDVVADPVGSPFTDTAFRTLVWGGQPGAGLCQRQHRPAHGQPHHRQGCQPGRRGPAPVQGAPARRRPHADAGCGGAAPQRPHLAADHRALAAGPACPGLCPGG